MIKPIGKAAGILLLCAALIGSCDRPSPSAPTASAGQLKAADAACEPPLWNFATSRRHLTGSFLDYPTNLVLIERTGLHRWNGEAVGRLLLGEYISQQAAIEPPVILVIQPARDAPCAAVLETISAALRLGRCSPQRCAFEWLPESDAPIPVPAAKAYPRP
jgi:hypothetical protein